VCACACDYTLCGVSRLKEQSSTFKSINLCAAQFPFLLLFFYSFIFFLSSEGLPPRACTPLKLIALLYPQCTFFFLRSGAYYIIRVHDAFIVVVIDRSIYIFFYTYISLLLLFIPTNRRFQSLSVFCFFRCVLKKKFLWLVLNSSYLFIRILQLIITTILQYIFVRRKEMHWHNVSFVYLFYTFKVVYG